MSFPTDRLQELVLGSFGNRLGLQKTRDPTHSKAFRVRAGFEMFWGGGALHRNNLWTLRVWLCQWVLGALNRT